VCTRLCGTGNGAPLQMLSDYVLDEDTLELFRENNWLGDENIEFFWEQIAKELNPNNVVSDILFVPPTVIMSVHHT
jgi:hypothetical protein